MQNTPLDIWWKWGPHPTREGLVRETAAGNVLIALGENDADVTGMPAAHAAGANASQQENPCNDAPADRTILGALVLNNVQGAEYPLAPWPVAAAPEEVAVIHLLCVSPTARGRGVAKQMLPAAAQTARERGARALRLDVFSNNAPAVALYRTCGFVDLGEFDLTVGGGLRHASHLMELAL